MAERPQYVTLAVEEELFAVPVAAVQEILGPCAITRLPQAPSQLLGVIDVRGRTIPVIDLRRKLGLTPVPATEGTRILVLEVPLDGRVVVLGLVADRVYEVTALDEDRVTPPPEIGTRWESGGIAGVGRRQGAFVIVFDLARLLTTEAALAPAAVPDLAA